MNNLKDTAPMKKSNGFTLIELMIVISIIGILMSVAVPSMRTYLSNSAANTLGSTLLIDIMYARNHAIANTAIVKMIPLGTVPDLNNRTGASTYTPNTAIGVNWALGWMIFADTNNNNIRDNNEFIIRQQNTFGPDAHISSGPGLHITSGTLAVLDAASPIGFDSLGFPSNIGVLSIAANGCAGDNGQYIQINQIGQVISRSGQCPAAFTNL